MSASERVVEASDPAEMVRQARVLGQATAHLITSIKVRTAVRLSIFIFTHRITLDIRAERVLSARRSYFN